MTKVKTTHYIGEPMFVVGDEGIVTRTAIKSLTKDGYEAFTAKPRGRVFFTLDEAIDAAEIIIQTAIEGGEVTRNREQVLRKRMLELRAPAFRDEVLAQKVIQGAQLFGIVPERSLDSDVIFPKEYFLPGEKVFGIVTPFSHYTFTPGWRPRLYFILSTVVDRVSFCDWRKGNLHYSFSKTHYSFAPDRIFRARKDALAALMRVFTEETGGTIPMENIPTFTAADEEAYNKKQLDEMIARHSKIMGGE